MTDFAIRREPGKVPVLVQASPQECEHARLFPDTTYTCPCENNGQNCGAEMRLVPETMVHHRGTVHKRTSFFATANKGVGHIEGCPNCPKTKRVIKLLANNPELVDFGNKLAQFERKKDHVQIPPPKPPGPGGGEVNPPPVKKREPDGDEEVEFRSAASISELYTVVTYLLPETVLGDGRCCKEVLINCRNYIEARRGELPLKGICMVVAEKCRNERIRKAYYGYQGNFTVILQDPYMSNDGRRLYYVLTIPKPSEYFLKENRDRIVEHVYKNDKLWLLMGSWECLESGKQTVYHTTIPSPQLIKPLNEKVVFEKDLRRHESF